MRGAGTGGESGGGETGWEWRTLRVLECGGNATADGAWTQGGSFVVGKGVIPGVESGVKAAAVQDAGVRLVWGSTERSAAFSTNVKLTLAILYRRRDNLPATR
jgi:hypothetical protein